MAYWPSRAVIGIILFLEFFSSGFLQQVDYDFDIDRTEKMFGDTETIVHYDWKVHRKSKEHLISGTINITQDIDNTFMRIVDAEFSAHGNKYFAKTPLKLGPLPACVFYNTSYRQYIEPNVIGKTNFPIIPPEGLCPIPKGIYYIKDISFRDTPNLPQHVAPGVWKINDKFMKGNKLVGGIFITARVHSTATS